MAAELKENDNDVPPPQPQMDINSILPKCLQNTSNRKCDLSEDLKLINPDIHELFNKYNKLYFDEEICFCEVKWIESKEENKDQDTNNNNNNNNSHKNNPKDKNGTKKQPSKKKKYAGKCITDSSGFCA